MLYFDKTNNKLIYQMKYITLHEAMTLTGYSRQSLYEMRKSGSIRWTCAKTGRKIRFHEGDLLKYCGIKQAA